MFRHGDRVRIVPSSVMFFDNAVNVGHIEHLVIPTSHYLWRLVLDDGLSYPIREDEIAHV